MMLPSPEGTAFSLFQLAKSQSGDTPSTTRRHSVDFSSARTGEVAIRRRSALWPLRAEGAPDSLRSRFCRFGRDGWDKINKRAKKLEEDVIRAPVRGGGYQILQEGGEEGKGEGEGAFAQPIGHNSHEQERGGSAELGETPRSSVGSSDSWRNAASYVDGGRTKGVESSYTSSRNSPSKGQRRHQSISQTAHTQ